MSASRATSTNRIIIGSIVVVLVALAALVMVRLGGNRPHLNQPASLCSGERFNDP